MKAVCLLLPGFFFHQNRTHIPIEKTVFELDSFFSAGNKKENLTQKTNT